MQVFDSFNYIEMAADGMGGGNLFLNFLCWMLNIRGSDVQNVLEQISKDGLHGVFGVQEEV